MGTILAVLIPAGRVAGRWKTFGAAPCNRNDQLSEIEGECVKKDIRIMVALFVGGLAWALGTPVEADVVVLEPEQDTYISEYVPGSNYGGNSTVLFGGLPYPNSDLNILLEYDVSSIPSDATVSEVRLTFERVSGTASLPAAVRRNISSWSQNTATWNSTSFGILVGSTTIDGSNSYPVAEVPALVATVQGWVDGSYSNHGLMLEALGTTSQLSFRSLEGSGNPIRLVVEFTVTSGEPDLVVEDMSVSDSNPGEGESFTASATVRNQGDAASESTTLRYYLSNDASISASDDQLSTDGVSSLSPGSTSDESDSESISTAGTYWIGACVDSVAGESNTANNCSSGVQVVVVPLGQPDLLAADITFSNPMPSIGETVVIGGTIQNTGSVASGDFNWELRYDSSVIDSGRTNVGAGGQVSAMINASVMITDSLVHQASLVVDVSDEVPESNEGNNSRTETISASSTGCVSELHDLNDNQVPSGWSIEIIRDGELSAGAIWGVPTDGGVRLVKPVGVSASGVGEITAEWDGDLQYSNWGVSNLFRMITTEGIEYHVLAGYSDHAPVGTSTPDTNFVRFTYGDGTKVVHIVPQEFGEFHYQLSLTDGQATIVSTRLSDGTEKFNITNPLPGLVLADIAEVKFQVYATTDNMVWMDNLFLEICANGNTVFSDDFESGSTLAWSSTSP